jgi:hypothetical protein
VTGGKKKNKTEVFIKEVCAAVEKASLGGVPTEVIHFNLQALSHKILMVVYEKSNEK